MDSARCRALLAAVEAGSITAAAGRLGYTPSGVSQLITALENDLGFHLIVRNRRGVTLTAAGKELLPALRDFVRAEEQILQQAAEIRGLDVGSVTIGSYPSISSHWLPEVILDFQKEYPGIEMHLLEGIRQEICEWLDSGRADIAFMTYMEPMPYDWYPLAEDAMLAVLAPDHPLAGEACYPLQACENEDFIMPAMGHDIDVEYLLESNGLVPEIRYSTLENFSAISMIEKGLGMSIMNELCTRSWQRNVVRLPLDPPQSIQFGLAVRSMRTTAPAVRKFAEFSLERLRNR